MEKYINAFLNGYGGYFNYLLDELLKPTWHNYFYWLLGLSLVVWSLEILFPLAQKPGDHPARLLAGCLLHVFQLLSVFPDRLQRGV